MENVCFELSGKMYTLPPPSVCVRVILDFDKPGGPVSWVLERFHIRVRVCVRVFVIGKSSP